MYSPRLIMPGFYDCRCCALASRPVPGCGSPFAKLMLVGEAPGREEDEQGYPFVGRAGQKLDQLLTTAGIVRGRLYITNVVRCRPSGHRKPSIEETKICSVWLEKELALIKPRVIVTLGATAYEYFGGSAISKNRGRAVRYGDLVIIPTFHPSYLLRKNNQDLDKLVLDDLQHAISLSQKISEGCI